MLSPSSPRFLKQVGSGLLCWIMFGGATAALAPALIPIYLAACAFVTWRSVRVAYISERFIDFSSLALLNWLAVCPLLSLVIGIALFERLMGMTAPQAIGLSLIPAIVTAIGYQIAKRLGSKSPFTVSNGKVTHTSNSKSSSVNMLVGGIGSALGATALSYFSAANKAQTAFWLYAFFFLTGLYYIYFLRHAISGIQDLKENERRTGKTLTPDDIQSIRTLRNRSLLGKWFRHIMK